MKRTWKNFRIDKNKVYMRIGQAVTYIAFNLLLSAFIYWAFLQRNDILGGGKMEELIKKMKQNFKEDNIKEESCKISYAIGYLEGNEKVSKQDLIEIIKRILKNEI